MRRCYLESREESNEEQSLWGKINIKVHLEALCPINKAKEERMKKICIFKECINKINLRTQRLNFKVWF